MYKNDYDTRIVTAQFPKYALSHLFDGRVLIEAVLQTASETHLVPRLELRCQQPYRCRDDLVYGLPQPPRPPSPVGSPQAVAWDDFIWSRDATGSSAIGAAGVMFSSRLDATDLWRRYTKLWNACWKGNDNAV